MVHYTHHLVPKKSTVRVTCPPERAVEILEHLLGSREEIPVLVTITVDSVAANQACLIASRSCPICKEGK